MSIRGAGRLIQIGISDLSFCFRFVANYVGNVFFWIFSAKSFFVPKIITIFAIDLIAKTIYNFKY